MRKENESFIYRRYRWKCRTTMIEDYLYRIRKDYQIDFVIANVENATHGKGLNRKHYDFFTFEGVDCMTMGNHTFDKKELLDFIDEC